MDVDGSSTASGGGGGSSAQQQQPQPEVASGALLPAPQAATNVADIDMSFLQQFSCLGTTDHDELVQQMQWIMGSQLNVTTARFFLDMNNWNLQAAVGCYFDFNLSQRLPDMRALGEVTVAVDEAVTPNTEFVASWNVQNSGDETWPPGCYLKCTSHPHEAPEFPVPVQPKPFEATIVSVTVRSPPTLGLFQATFRLCTSFGSYFGDILRVTVTVAENGTLAETQRTRGSVPTVLNAGGDPIAQPIILGPLQMIEGTQPAFSNAANTDQLPTPEDAEMW